MSTTQHWTEQEKGWWTASRRIGGATHCMGVCKERDGRWHSYVGDDSLQSAPGFRTMKRAMDDAEARTKLANVKDQRPGRQPKS